MSTDVVKHLLANWCPVVTERQGDSADGTCCPRQDKAKGTYTHPSQPNTHPVQGFKNILVEGLNQLNLEMPKNFRLSDVTLGLFQNVS